MNNLQHDLLKLMKPGLDDGRGDSRPPAIFDLITVENYRAAAAFQHALHVINAAEVTYAPIISKRMAIHRQEVAEAKAKHAVDKAEYFQRQKAADEAYQRLAVIDRKWFGKITHRAEIRRLDIITHGAMYSPQVPKVYSENTTAIIDRERSRITSLMVRCQVSVDPRKLYARDATSIYWIEQDVQEWLHRHKVFKLLRDEAQA